MKLKLRRIKEPAPVNKELNNFFLLLQEGYHAGILDSPLVEKIQTGIASLFTELFVKYTCGDSSSVKEETAINILCSVYYVLDLYTSSLTGPEAFFAALKQKSFKEIYKEGIELASAYFEESKILYRELAANKLKIPLEAYQDTISKALPEFFNTYDLEFAAHETTSSMDYPLVFDDMSFRGIIFIMQYLEKLKLETDFCRGFSLDGILKTLHSYSVKFRLDIINAPVNLFEILFDQAVFAVLSGNEAKELTVSKRQCDALISRLSILRQEELTAVVEQTIREIMK